MNTKKLSDWAKENGVHYRTAMVWMHEGKLPVRVTLQLLNGFGAGRVLSFSARHVNRLSDPIVRMNDGNPLHTIEVRRA